MCHCSRSGNALRLLAISLTLAPLAGPAWGSDWTRFRGENGAGVSLDDGPLPARWSDRENLKWSKELPGAGKSCPIIVGDRVILTCWTGTGPDDLMRHVMCFDRNTGNELWSKEVAPAIQDEPFEQMFTQNGYTSHTPVSDGEQIFCFFGVTGVIAFDMDGNVAWGPKSVGTGFNRQRWGSAASPILYKDLVIVNAGAESNSLVALRKDTGEVAWSEPYTNDKLNGVWGTPVIMDRGDGSHDIVISLGGEIVGLDPETGKQRWNAVGGRGDGARLSVITDGRTAYALGERGGRMFAVRGGGEGDVTESHIAWNENYQGNIGTPVYSDGLIYWVSGPTVNCIDAETGERVYQEQTQAPTATTAAAPVTPPPSPQADEDEGQRRQRPGGPGGFGGGPRGGRGGRGGGMMSMDYSSPVIADGKLYFTRRNGEVYVFKTGREFQQLAVNKFGADEGDFSSTPAVSEGQIFIRSDKKLYCVANVP